MNIEITDYIDVEAKAREVGLNLPSGLALVPENFLDATSRGDLLQHDHTPTIRSLWRQNGIVETEFEREDDHLGQKAERGFEEWVAPTIFIAASLWSQNSVAVTMAINVISNYLTSILQGMPFKSVRLKVVMEVAETAKDGTTQRCYREVNYSGDASGLDKLPAILHEVYEGKESDGAQNGE